MTGQHAEPISTAGRPCAAQPRYAGTSSPGTAWCFAYRTWCSTGRPPTS